MNNMSEGKILVVEDPAVEKSAVMSKAVDLLCRELAGKGSSTERVGCWEEALPLLGNEMDWEAILLAVDPAADPAEARKSEKLLRLIACRQKNVPLFLMADREKSAAFLSPQEWNGSLEFIWIFEDSARFIAGRIMAAVRRFQQQLLPPLFRAVTDYDQDNHEYSWAAPGHQGGKGFTKSSVGKKFYDFYGENLFRTDTGIERVSIGSLLDHSGSFAECETQAAKVFGADYSLNGVVGTSGSNRAVMQSILTEGDLAICDRNCHKSIEQGLINTGAIPVYCIPTRNHYGIIGPIPPSEMSGEAIRKKIQASPLPVSGEKRAYSVVTNCTYDGLCYHAENVTASLEKSTDTIHFDEAWYAYARFNPLYQHHFAMQGEPGKRQGPALLATHSTHKLLTALSQASFIHVRHGKKEIPMERMNQGYLLNATTSPLYAICASNDVAVKSMADSGRALTQEVIEEAVDFRQALARMERSFREKNDWFFRIWNAPEVTDPHSGLHYPFADAPRHLLTHEQSCWRLRPGEKWHGFSGLPDENWVMLDPIKVSILTPGMSEDGCYEEMGVPAALVSSFLYDVGIVPTRSTDFQLMFLFSIGITRGKWVTLLNALVRFKTLYDRNVPVAEILPDLTGRAPEKYASLGIRDLGRMMYRYLKENRPGEKLDAAFETLPAAVMTPRKAYQEMIRDHWELLPPDQLAGRVAANAVIPYPPGIPMVISGESFAPDSPQAAYLQALARWDREFPGFEHVTEGCIVKEGVYFVPCIRQDFV